MKIRNLFALLVVVLVSVSILFAQTETKKTDAAIEKQKACCPSDKAAKTKAKSEGKTSDCTSKDATHKHDGNSDCMKKETTKNISMYSCPMHPEITSDKEGKCSKCGMALTKKAMPKAVTKSETHAEMYVCPMHPEEKSDKPSKCSKCGTNLKKIK
ncbi:MAG: heavy metal-binding domain-containing protein [Bacteroidota bacterium]|nr:heavy metal-binding domain-containing protein [Bacteroidota bacterium]